MFRSFSRSDRAVIRYKAYSSSFYQTIPFKALSCSNHSGLTEMADTEEKIKQVYAENLKADAYVAFTEHFWSIIYPDLFRSMKIFMHDAFNSGKFKGSKLLDIGSGAVVHNIAPASAHFSNIVMSDYVEDNVEQLKRWLRGEANFKQLLDIPAELEASGSDLESTRKMLEARIRKNVKRVTRCDFLTDGILMDKSSDPDTSPPFDMIIACLCLEAAPADLDGYFGTFKRINEILRPGGGFLATGFLQGGIWKVEDKVFHHIKVSEEDLQKALTQAGFGVINLKTFLNPYSDNRGYEFDKFYCLTAKKL